MRFFLFFILIVLVQGSNAQNSIPFSQTNDLSNIKYIDEEGLPIIPYTSSYNLLENSVPLGSAGNLYTIIRSSINMVVADESLNTVVFLHRNDPFLFGESTSQYRYDISTDGGLTFENNIGPLSTIADGSSGPHSNARYPQVALHNNGTIDNSQLVYFGATHDGVNWDGSTWGTAQLNNDPNSFTSDAAVWNNSNVYITEGLTQGLPGEYWACNFEYIDEYVIEKVILYKGVIDPDNPVGITWEIYQTFDSLYDHYWANNGNYQSPASTMSMGFSPDGMTGYMMNMCDGILPEYGLDVYAPYMWTTNDGGVTWDGPTTVDIRNFGGFIQDEFNSTNLPSFSFYSPDITVDANGDAHIACLLGDLYQNNSYTMDPANNSNEVIDIVYSASTDTWKVFRFGDGIDTKIKTPIDTIVWGESSVFRNTTRLQAARNADGSKIFFTWLDSEPAQSSGDYVAWRDLNGVGLDIATELSTPVYNWTVDNPDWAGKAYFSTCSPQVLVDGDTYKIPAVFTEIDIETSTENSETFFHYFQGATINESDFTITNTLVEYNESPPIITNINQEGNDISRSFSLEGIDPGFVYQVTWDFGDGNTATGFSSSHEFPNEEMTYTVTACAENYDGLTCATTEVTIIPVNDNIAPEINLTDGETLIIEGGLEETYQQPNFTATDQIGIDGSIVDVTENVIVTGTYDPTMLGDYPITYMVTDDAGNPTTITQTVTVVDTEAPNLEAQVSTDRTLCLGEPLTDINILFTVEDAFIPSSTEDFEPFVSFVAPDSYDETGVYEVEYIATDPNDNSSEPIVVTYTVCECDENDDCIDNTSIEDLQLSNDIALVPNPTSGIVNMTVANINNQFTVKVYDVQGKEFWVEKNYSNSNVTLDLTNAPSGIYFVKVETTEAVAVKRIIVE